MMNPRIDLRMDRSLNEPTGKRTDGPTDAPIGGSLYGPHADPQIDEYNETRLGDAREPPAPCHSVGESQGEATWPADTDLAV